MKQKSNNLMISVSALTKRQMLALTGGEESSATTTPPVITPEDIDPANASITNVLKTRHETAKNSISNVR